MISVLIAFAVTQALPEAEIAEAGAALAQCAVPRLRAAASGPESADALVTATLEACVTERTRIRNIFARVLGEPYADATFEALINQLRPRLIRVVDAQRGLASRPQTEATAWGDCIRTRAAALAPSPGAIDGLADQAMEQCAPQREAVRSALGREHNIATVDQMMPSLIAASRSVAIQTIQQVRGGNHGRE